MIGKLISKAVGLPFRAANLAAKAVEVTVRGPSDFILDEKLSTPITDAAQDAIKRGEQAIEKALDG